jgi:hypothetical protein
LFTSIAIKAFFASRPIPALRGYLDFMTEEEPSVVK